MDTSTRLSFMLGTLRIPANEITPAEWLAVIKANLEDCKPSLKYMNGLVEIKKLLNPESRNAYDSKTTAYELVRFPQGISVTTRCVLIAQIERRNVVPENKRAFPLFYEERALVLTDSGQWLEWTACYGCRTIGGLGFRSHHFGRQEIAQQSEFVELDDSGLLRIITEMKPSPRALIERPLDLLISTILERDVVTASLRGKHEKMLARYKHIKL